MKRLMFAGGLIVLALCLASPALADYQDEDPRCTSVNDAFCLDTNDDTASIPGGNPLVPATSQLPIQGIIAASPGSNPADNAYLFFDGDMNNTDPLAGYIGLDAKLGNLVAADEGNFDRADNPINQTIDQFLTGLGGGGAPGLPALPELPGLPGGLPALPDLPVSLPLP